MSKICPLSMANEPTECYAEDCMIYDYGECQLNKATLSLYFIAKNLKAIAEGTTDYDDLR